MCKFCNILFLPFCALSSPIQCNENGPSSHLWLYSFDRSASVITRRCVAHGCVSIIAACVQRMHGIVSNARDNLLKIPK